MIRINLLADVKRNRRGGFSISKGILIKIGVSLGVLIIAVVTLSVVSSLLKNSPDSLKPKYIVRDDYSASSLLKRKSVEEIVKYRDDRGEKIDKNGILKLSYNDLSFIEKVNYENRFTREVISILSQTFKTGVNFRKLKIDSYQYFIGNGISDSRNQIKEVFVALRKNGLILEPKPATTIFKSKDGYSFKIKSSLETGLDLSAPFIMSQEDIPAYDDLEIVIKRLLDAFNESGLKINKGPQRSAANVVDGFRRLSYQITCKGSYRNFSALVDRMYKEQIPCSIKSCTLIARSTNSLDMDITIVITTKR